MYFNLHQIENCYYNVGINRNKLNESNCYNANDYTYFSTSHYDESTQHNNIYDIDSYTIFEVSVDQHLIYVSYNDMIKHDIPREIDD